MDPFRPGRVTRLCTSEHIVQWNFDDGGGGEIFVFEKRRGEGGDLPPFDKWAVGQAMDGACPRNIHLWQVRALMVRKNEQDV